MNRPLPSYFSLTFRLKKCMKCYLKALDLGRIYGQWNDTAGPIAIAIANRSSVFVWMRETGYTTPNLCWRKMKYSVSPYPDSCGCGLRYFLLTSDGSLVAEAMSCATSSWRNKAISMVTCVFFSFALVEILLSCPSCAWRKDRLILPSYQWKCSSGRTGVKAVVSWCFGLVQSPNDVKQRLTTTPWNILKQSCLLSLNWSTQNLSKNGTLPLGGKFSQVFEKCAKVIFKLGTGHYLSPGGRIWG